MQLMLHLLLTIAVPYESFGLCSSDADLSARALLTGLWWRTAQNGTLQLAQARERPAKVQCVEKSRTTW